jgi:hypothetical protein
VAIGAAGDGFGRDRVDVVLAGDQLGHHDALVAGLVRQPRRPASVADGIEPLDPGAAVGSVTTWVRSILTPSFPAPGFGVGDDADGGDDGVELHRLGLAAASIWAVTLSFGAVELLTMAPST